MMPTIICAWCKTIIKDGEPLKISHGICPSCYEAQIIAMGLKNKETVKIINPARATLEELNI